MQYTEEGWLVVSVNGKFFRYSIVDLSFILKIMKSFIDYISMKTENKQHVYTMYMKKRLKYSLYLI